MRVRIDALDCLFSEFIRKRSGGCCERCGKWHGWKGLQCAHFIGRSNRSTRWDEDNACALCFGCHQYLGSHPLEHLEFFKDRLGAVRFDLLRARSRTLARYVDKNALTLYFKQKIKELDKGE